MIDLTKENYEAEVKQETLFGKSRNFFYHFGQQKISVKDAVVIIVNFLDKAVCFIFTENFEFGRETPVIRSMTAGQMNENNLFQCFIL